MVYGFNLLILKNFPFGTDLGGVRVKTKNSCILLLQKVGRKVNPAASYSPLITYHKGPDRDFKERYRNREYQDTFSSSTLRPWCDPCRVPYSVTDLYVAGLFDRLGGGGHTLTFRFDDFTTLNKQSTLLDRIRLVILAF